MPSSSRTRLPMLPIYYRGCALDSVDELRYLLSIEADYRFLREPVAIGYYPITRRSTDRHCDGVHFLVPDFLIRHKQSTKALLIDVRSIDCSVSSMEDYHDTAIHFVFRKGYDWRPQIVFTHNIVLTSDQDERCRNILTASQRRVVPSSQHRPSVPTFQETGWDSRRYASWVRWGQSH